MRMKRIGVTTCVVALVLCTALAALPGVALADASLNLPDNAFQNALIAAGVDANHDGSLTAAEMASFTGGPDGLDLHGKDISNLLGLGYMVSLKSLNLNDNNIAAIPAEIKNCRELSTLDIGSNPISALPAELTGLTKLKTLKLSGTSLEALPADMGKLTALETLDISSTSFTALPVQIKDLPALTVLNASNLGLTSLPSWLGQCSGLQQLNLDGNGLSALPDLSGLTNLTVLKMNSNDFSALPQQVTALASLQCLELCYNRLNTLGANINLLTGLTTLRLSGNALDQLPSEIGSLTNLTTLELDSNSLSALPASLGNLTNLLVLNLSGNRLSDLPTDVFRNMNHLAQLNLSMNYLNPTPGSSDVVEINKASAQKQYSDQVSFTLICGNGGQSPECYQGETVSLPPPLPQDIPAGKSFVGWDLNGDGNAETDENGNGVFVAQNFQNISVTYNWVLADNGQAVVAFRAGDHGRVDGSTGTVRMLANGKIVAGVPSVQADEGYRFAGWRRSSDNALFVKPEDVLVQTFEASDEFTAEYAGNSANLSVLSANAGELSPAFYPYSYSYVLIVPDSAPDTGTTTLTAAVQGIGATLTMDGAVSPLSVDVAKGKSKSVSIVVTAPDGMTQKTYTVKVVHADMSGAALSSLTLSSGGQPKYTDEDVNASTLTYNVNLSPDDDALHIQAGAVLGATVAYQTRIDGGSFVPLPLDGIYFNVSAGVDFQVNLRVTSRDGYSQQIYQLFIHRAWSTDCTLGTLTGSTDITKVSESDSAVGYTMLLPENTPSGTIQFQTNYRFAKAIVTNATPVDGAITVPLETGESRTVRIQVMAQDPSVTKTYEITVTREKSSNANLGNLTLDAGILQQTVSAETTSYTAFVPYDHNSVTINTSAQNKYGSVSLADNGSNLSLAIASGQTLTVHIVVTAQNGSTRNYSLQLTRETPVDLNLSSLSVSGVALNAGFSAANLNYTVSMPAGMDSLPIAASTADTRAWVTIAGIAGNNAQVGVPAGRPTDIQITVHSPQNASTQTYTITATRMVSLIAFGGQPAIGATAVYSPGGTNRLSFNYTLNGPATVRLEVYYKKVWTTVLTRNETSEGVKTFAWDGKIAKKLLPAGTYSARISATYQGQKTNTMQMSFKIVGAPKLTWTSVIKSVKRTSGAVRICAFKVSQPTNAVVQVLNSRNRIVATYQWVNVLPGTIVPVTWSPAGQTPATFKIKLTIGAISYTKTFKVTK